VTLSSGYSKACSAARAEWQISATDSDVYYAAYNRTIFRSTDGAVTWQAARHFAEEVVNIAVDPTDGDRFYVAALEDGVWRSDDAGQTFTKIAGVTGGNAVWSVGVGGANGQTVYYATNSGAGHQVAERGDHAPAPHAPEHYVHSR
jgi:hypothetical protein